MKHYLMTASHRGPDYPLDANRRRIDLCRGITARSLAAQTGDWTWIVYVNPQDPLLDERLDACRSAGRPVVPVQGTPEAEAAIDWTGLVLTTRIDDDDAFTADAFARLYRSLVKRPTEPTALMFPVGYRVRDGYAQREVHFRNAWSSLYSPPGFRVHIRQVQHQRIPRHFPVRNIDSAPAWLRVRHQDNNQPSHRRAHQPITAAIRALYPVDWDLLAPRVAA